jgi:hypothetical protein
MRLLEISGSNVFSLTKEVLDNDIPRYPYAILSHTWGRDGEEVTFDDLLKRAGKDKAGYKKILFCAKQAARDGLQYFWVDTCCNIQTHHLRQCPMKRVAYAAENGGSWYIAF